MDKRFTDILIVIAAGGQGTRIGGNKSQRMLGGVSLLARAIRLAERWSDHIIVSGTLDGAEEALARGYPVLPDAQPDMGPLAALATGFAEASTQSNIRAILMLPCDTPFLPDDLAARLSATLEATADSKVATPYHSGDAHPACALWSIGCAALLPAYLATGRRALIGFAEKVGMVQVDWEQTGDDPFLNINRLEDLHEAEKRL